MPRRIVEKYRLLYKNYFLNQSLDLKLNDDAIKVPAFYSEEDKVKYADFFGKDPKLHLKGFPGVYIYVQYGKETLPGVWATNNIRVDKIEKNVESAVIMLNPRLFLKKRTFQREVLAHEFVEVVTRMMSLDRAAQMKGNVGLSFTLQLLSTELSRDCIQLDPNVSRRELDTAIEELLVSRPSLDEVASDLGIEISNIVELLKIDETPNLIVAAGHINKIQEAFTSRWGVEKMMVFNRLIAEIKS